MSEPAYSLEQLRRLRQRQQQSSDPNLDSSDISETATDRETSPSIFDGKRYTPEEWIWNHINVVPVEPKPDEKCPVHWADCGATRVWIVKDGSRWLMYVGSRQPDSRRTDFASPFLNHAIETAEYWYGLPRDGWHVEKDN